MKQELGYELDMGLVTDELVNHLKDLFEFELI